MSIGWKVSCPARCPDRIDASLSAYKLTTKYPITNLATGDKTTQDVSGARLKFLFKVTDNLDVQLMAHDELTQGHGFNFVYTYITPGHDLLFTPGPFTQASLLPGITPGPNNLVYKSPERSRPRAPRTAITTTASLANYRLPGGYYAHRDRRL